MPDRVCGGGRAPVYIHLGGWEGDQEGGVQADRSSHHWLRGLRTVSSQALYGMGGAITGSVQSRSQDSALLKSYSA